MRAATLMLLLLNFSSAGAADTYKCQDRAARITYSNSTCEKLGLKSAGVVQDRTTVLPAESGSNESRRAEQPRERPPATSRGGRVSRDPDPIPPTAAEPPLSGDDEERPGRAPVLTPVNPLIKRVLK